MRVSAPLITKILSENTNRNIVMVHACKGILRKTMAARSIIPRSISWTTRQHKVVERSEIVWLLCYGNSCETLRFVQTSVFIRNRWLFIAIVLYTAKNPPGTEDFEHILDLEYISYFLRQCICALYTSMALYQYTRCVNIPFYLGSWSAAQAKIHFFSIKHSIER